VTTLRQIKRVFKPLMERHADVFMVGGRTLWVGPVHHVVRRIFMDSTSMVDCVAPQWNAQEMFLPARRPDQHMCHYEFHYMRDPPGEDVLFGKSWQWSDPTMVPHLVSMLENEALPFLRTLDSLESYAVVHRRLLDGSFFVHREDRMLLAIALGELDRARTMCQELLPRYRENKDPDWWLYQSLRTAVVTVAEPLMAGDRAALAAILHGWEEANVRGTVLEPHWEPTPFPLETM